MPIYHSLYDSYAHYQRFGDPGLKYIDALSKIDLRIVLRVANADILPWDYAATAAALQKEIEDLQSYNRSLAEHARRRNELLDQHAYAQAAVSWRGEAEPAHQDADIAQIDLAELKSASQGLSQQAQTFAAIYDQSAASPRLSAADLKRANDALRSVEQAMLGRGLSGRPWYRHLLQAPSQQEGSDLETLPAIRDAIDQHQWDAARLAVPTTARAVEAAGNQLARATTVLTHQ